MAIGCAKRVKEGDTKPTRYYSKKQETAVAKALDGKVIANSGAGMFQKGDVTSDAWLIECKTKTKSSDSISVKKDWIEKNKQEALFMGKHYSAVAINFGPDEPNYYLIDEYLFQDLIEYLNMKKEEQS